MSNYIDVPVKLVYRPLEKGEKPGSIMYMKPKYMRWDTAIVYYVFHWMFGYLDVKDPK
jgi:hypothetical protein